MLGSEAFRAVLTKGELHIFDAIILQCFWFATPDIINLRNLVAPSPSSIIFFASFLETFMIKCLRM